MLLPNPHSFLLIRQAKNRAPETPADSALSPLPSDGVKSGRKMLLPNSYSFLLAGTVTARRVVYSVDGEAPLETPADDESPRRTSHEIQSAAQESLTDLSPPPASPGSSPDSGEPTINDKNKRAFLKAAGIAGASFVASLLFPTKKAEALILGSSPTTGVVGVKDASNVRINPATEETVSTLLKPSDLSFESGAVKVKVIDPGSFSDSANVPKSALVDTDRHVQVDVLSSALPTSASTEPTLQTIAFGGTKFALRLATDSGNSNLEYVGEAQPGTSTTAALWRIKRIDSTSGVVIQWADGNASFDNIWDNRESLSYS